MAKPFKITTNTPRDERGRFQQLTPPAPPQVVDAARAEGTSADRYVAEVRVPDHPVAETGKRAGGGFVEEKPWEPAGPVNDANKKPMRVG